MSDPYPYPSSSSPSSGVPLDPTLTPQQQSGGPSNTTSSSEQPNSNVVVLDPNVDYVAVKLEKTPSSNTETTTIKDHALTTTTTHTSSSVTSLLRLRKRNSTTNNTDAVSMANTMSTSRSKKPTFFQSRPVQVVLESVTDQARHSVPFIRTVRDYQLDFLKSDLIAGLSVAVLLLPQAMAYAVLAGLPPVYGLYSSLIPPIMYAIFGTSRHLSVAPVALSSVVLASSISPIATQGSARYIELALAATFLKGVMSFVMGIFNLGYVVTFISDSVLHGFVAAAASIITITQIDSLLGIKIVRSDYIVISIYRICKSLPDANWIAAVIGILSLASLMILKKLHPLVSRLRFMIVTVVTTVIAYLIINFSSGKFPVVGSVPGGLPTFTFTLNTVGSDISQVFISAFLLTIIGFLESFAISVKYGAEFGYTIKPSQELVALGFSNTLGSLFQSFATTGSFSRSAVYASTGGKTQIAQIITAGIVLVALVGLTPLFYYIPKSVLAAIILTAVIPLIEVHQFIEMYRTKKRDFFVAFVTFLATFFWTIPIGLAIGVVFALLSVLWTVSRPSMIILGELKHDVWRNVLRYPNATRQHPGILAVRFDAPLWFPNVKYFEAKLLELLDNACVAHANGVSLDVVAKALKWTDLDAVHLMRKLRAEAKKKRKSELAQKKLEEKERKKLERAGKPKTKLAGCFDGFKTRLRFQRLRKVDEPSASNVELAELGQISSTENDTNSNADNVGTNTSNNVPTTTANTCAAKDKRACDNIKYLVLDCAPLSDIDFSGCETLIELSNVLYKTRDIQILLSGANYQVRDVLNRAKAFDGKRSRLRLNGCFLNVRGAVKFALRQMNIAPVDMESSQELLPENDVNTTITSKPEETRPGSSSEPSLAVKSLAAVKESRTSFRTPRASVVADKPAKFDTETEGEDVIVFSDEDKN